MLERRRKYDPDERFSLFPLEAEEALERLLQGTEADPGPGPGTATIYRNAGEDDDSEDGPAF